MLKWWTRLESLDGFSCHGVCCSGKGAVLLCWALIAIDVTGLTKMMLLKIRSFWSDTVFKLVMLTGWCRVNNWACLSEAWWEFHVALIGCFWATKGSRLLTEGVLETLLSYVVTRGLWKEMEELKSPEYFFRQPLCCAVKMHSLTKNGCLNAPLGEFRKAQVAPEVWFPDGFSSLLKSAIVALLRALHSAHANHFVSNSSNNF